MCAYAGIVIYYVLVMQRLEKAAKELSEQATSGIFLDPDNNPMKILRVMKGVGLLDVHVEL